MEKLKLLHHLIIITKTKTDIYNVNISMTESEIILLTEHIERNHFEYPFVICNTCYQN